MQQGQNPPTLELQPPLLLLAVPDVVVAPEEPLLLPIVEVEAALDPVVAPAVPVADEDVPLPEALLPAVVVVAEEVWLDVPPLEAVLTVVPPEEVPLLSDTVVVHPIAMNGRSAHVPRRIESMICYLRLPAGLTGRI